MSNFSRLALLAQPSTYNGGHSPLQRWGQLLRESPAVRALLNRAAEAELLLPLSKVARLRGGVVTRANAYFLVREVPFDQIPNRFKITRNDYHRVAVVMDGLETPFRIEREFLKPVLKGPEALVTIDEVEETDLRVFVVDMDKDSLRAKRASGALEYLTRGETFSYNVSEDSLKGGIPAKRSQIKNRRPHWYSLSVPQVTGPRIVIPEHLERRYIATLLPPEDECVVIDKLFVAEPYDSAHANIILASLNSLLGWYQIELRGRTQLGLGVLEVKKADLHGVLVLNPRKLNEDHIQRLLEAFEPLRDVRSRESVDEVTTPARIGFDEIVLELLGSEEPEHDRLKLERELRAAIAERSERRASVSEAKVDRKRTSTIAANVDAYAARLASLLETHPSPASLVAAGSPSWPVPIVAPVEGDLTIGVELFDQGNVYANGVCVAHASDMLGAQYVRAVLLTDPGATSVDVPAEPVLTDVMSEWKTLAAAWRGKFNTCALDVTGAIQDPRLRDEITRRALKLLHAV